MTPDTRAPRRRSLRASRRPGRSAKRLLFESLEDRRLLTGSFATDGLALAAPHFSSGDSGLMGNAAANPLQILCPQNLPDSGLRPVTAQRETTACSSTAASGGMLPGTAWATAVDDAFENNDSWYQAANLGTLQRPGVVENLVMADRADWYRFTLDQSANSSGEVRIQFNHGRGDLDLAIYDSGGRLVARSNGVTDSERVSLDGVSAGSYFVLVYGYRGAVNPSYSLRIDPGQTVPDDRFEPNNSLSRAANFGTISARGTASNLVMADAADWYRFTLGRAGTADSFVGISFRHAQGDLDLVVYDANGHRIGYSNGVSDTERVSLEGLPAGTYYVCAYGYRGATNPAYTMTINPGQPTSTPTATPAAAPESSSSSSPTSTSEVPTSTTSDYQIEMNFHGLTASQQTIFRGAALRWQEVVTGDLPDAMYNGRTVDDLLIDVTVGYIDGPGGVLGGASADRFRAGTLLPYHGTIQFDSADVSQMEANGTLRDVIIHEIGHVLGIGTLWQALGLLSGADTSNPQFTGTHATAEYNALTSGHATSVPVANTGGSGTRDSHWRESVFTSELMTGYVGPGSTLPLSRLTIASLADLGYEVDLSTADPYSLA